MQKYSYLSGTDIGYIEDLYKKYSVDPDGLDNTWQKFFEGFELALASGNKKNGESGSSKTDSELKVFALINAYRARAHLRSDTNPVRERRDRKPFIDIEDFGLDKSYLDETFSAGAEIGLENATLGRILETLKKAYQGTVGFEYMYIRDPEIQGWFKEKAEKEFISYSPSLENKKRILEKLNEAVVFENFLHTKYVGQKRFSLEGGETTIPALDAIINRGAELGTEEVVIGMAHRGRLNVLANIMGKTYEQIFNEFEGNVIPDLTMGDGDVKYHLGYSSEVTASGNKKVNLKLAPNPSHLEAVAPVVLGFVRSKAYRSYQSDYNKIIPVIIHGDAAVAGQGLVYEVAQMSKLPGYYTGGTIHFVINNQVGFTTDFDEARSSIYCTDVAKVIDAPVIHVNGDDPEAVIFAVNTAVEYRQKFHRDIFVDMVCYRRHGHNESDEPKFTQPTLYEIISKHPNPREVYNRQLVKRGEIEKELADNMDKEFRKLLQDRLNYVKQNKLPYTYTSLEEEWRKLKRAKPEDFDSSPETGVVQENIEKVINSLVVLPENFTAVKQIEKLINDRKKMFFDSKAVNWPTAELLAFGTVLLDKKIVRFCGQDSQRGTFSQRHSVLHDAKTNEVYSSLEHIDKEQGGIRIFNSLLSEFGALGFEFGYAMANPNALTIWEAQFGDFSNGAQVIIDQFISNSESKWQRMNGLVMLLPHGYEGQGPEHSSARLERYLQLCGEYNMVVAYPTLPANYFHLLRRQVAWDFRKPLVVMTPKSLLRHPKVMSPLEEFSSGRFREVITDSFAEAAQVKRIILCSGKIYYDLAEKQENENRKDVAIVRLEQLYPFPEKQVNEIIESYNNPELFWVQEEPENMGAWSFILRKINRKISVVSRKESASPATGFAKVHKLEQEEILRKAFD